MTLSDHLRQAGTFLTSEEARARLLEEVHLRVHQRLIEELGPELSQGRLTAKDLRPRVNAHLQAALAGTTDLAAVNISARTALATTLLTSSGDGQMSARKTGLPSLSVPRDSRSRSMSIVPASA